MNDKQKPQSDERPREDGCMNSENLEITPLMKGARIGRMTAVFLTLCFAALMGVPIIQEILTNPQPSLLSRSEEDFKKFGFQLTLQEVEKHLVYNSQFASMVRQPYQGFLTRSLGQGSRSVLIGKDGFLFHRTDVVSTTGLSILSEQFLKEPQSGTDIVDDLVKTILKPWKTTKPEEIPAIPSQPPVDSLTVLSDFHEKLSSRGIHLVIVIVPSKSTIYPEKMWPNYPLSAGPAWNSGYPEWRRQLIEKKVDVLDLSERFWQAKAHDQELLFLEQDSHWSPRGVAIGAEAVADRVRGFLGKYQPIPLVVRKQTIPEPNDLVVLLGLRPEKTLFPQPPIELTQVVPANAENSATADLGPILLFGDSLTAYYDTRNIGSKAGFAQQLMLRLNTGVQTFVGFGDDSPIAIQNALARRPSVLKNKKVVVLEFAMSALYSKRFSTLFSVK